MNKSTIYCYNDRDLIEAVNSMDDEELCEIKVIDGDKRYYFMGINAHINKSRWDSILRGYLRNKTGYQKSTERKELTEVEELGISIGTMLKDSESGNVLEVTNVTSNSVEIYILKTKATGINHRQWFSVSRGRTMKEFQDRFSIV